MQHTIDREGYDLARWLAEQGIAAFVLKYRLARDGSTPVPSDLEQMPHLLNIIESNGVMLSNHHTQLISHTWNADSGRDRGQPDSAGAKSAVQCADLRKRFVTTDLQDSRKEESSRGANPRPFSSLHLAHHFLVLPTGVGNRRGHGRNSQMGLSVGDVRITETHQRDSMGSFSAV